MVPAEPLEGRLAALLAALLAAVQASPKYRHIHPDFIRRVGAEAFAKGYKLNAAIKDTKNKLHQVGGAYQVARPAYPAWLEALRAAGTPQEQKAACLQAMRQHASTRERLPILAEFYATPWQTSPLSTPF
jgi:16S rRNA (guanine(1405)-N(7))-methyltransferase